jgi:hypothetical protein
MWRKKQYSKTKRCNKIKEKRNLTIEEKIGKFKCKNSIKTRNSKLNNLEKKR